MRKITEESINAFYKRKPFKKDNTRVVVDGFETKLILFNNTIAILQDNDDLEITTCGYNTNTTRERLNGLKNVFLRTKNGQLNLNGYKWDGKLIKL